ncbi:MAG: hypothetical protein K2Y37_22100 [Pirellulales bacterium]|nr:hypothetical protein [Pirellulales bacterium]
MSDGLHAPDATELPALAEFVERAPPRRIGRPWLAWAVILALTALITWGQTTRSRKDPDEQQLAGDTKSFVFDLQARYTIGAVNSGLPIKESERRQFFDQLQSMSAGGNRLRLVVAAGELVGPKQALAEIAKLPDDLSASPEAQTLKHLYESYAAAQATQSKPEAEQSADDQAAIDALAAPPISPAERAALIERLGWFGLLATVPPGTPATQERAAALAPAIRAFGLVFGALGLGCVAGLLGFAMLIALVAFAAYGSLRGLQVGSPFGGVYAETFAAWMAIFLGLGFLTALSENRCCIKQPELRGFRSVG